MGRTVSTLPASGAVASVATLCGCGNVGSEPEVGVIARPVAKKEHRLKERHAGVRLRCTEGRGLADAAMMRLR